MKLPDLVMIPFTGAPGPHQITKTVEVQSGTSVGAHSAAAGTADRESFHLRGCGQPLESSRPALHFSSHQVIAGLRHVIGSQDLTTGLEGIPIESPLAGEPYMAACRHTGRD